MIEIETMEFVKGGVVFELYIYLDILYRRRAYIIAIQNSVNINF